MDLNERYGDNTIVLTIEKDDVTAHCTPDADGEVFVAGEWVGDTPKDHDAPFNIDIFFEDRHPRPNEITTLTDELADEFCEQFDETVDNVVEQIENSEEPLDTIMEMEPDDLI